MRISITAKAKNDLLQIDEFLSIRNPQAAERFAQRFNACLRNLSEFPFIGRERPSLAAGVRSLVCGVHVVLYVGASSEIVVLRVIDGRMDIDEEFQR